MAIKPDNQCPYCHGTGVVADWVDYGSTKVAMDSECDCVFESDANRLADARVGNNIITLWYDPDDASYYVQRNGFAVAECATEAEGWVAYERELQEG